MPSRKAAEPKPPDADRMSHADASRILHELWAGKQVEAAAARCEERAQRMREVAALSVAITALGVLSG